jgi:transcriptional regulator GlxA family with amidase domain
MDLALSLVEEDLGREIALKVARILVLYLKRPGGQSQYSRQLRAQAAEGGRLTLLRSWMSKNYTLPLTVELLAERAAMSPRNFARIFVLETGTTSAH